MLVAVDLYPAALNREQDKLKVQVEQQLGCHGRALLLARTECVCVMVPQTWLMSKG